MTIRRLMAAVAIVAFLTSVLICMSDFELDDRFDGAESKGQPRSWEVAASPRIVVDACDGAIIVKPSLDGRVTAVVTRHTLCKNLTEAVAKDALRFVQAEMIQDGDTIRIVTRPTADLPKNTYAWTHTYVSVSTTVELTVPDEARLDLRTGDGSIWVVGKPGAIQARNAGGVIGFDLGPVRLADKSTGVLKLVGYNGEASAEVDGEGYRYRGIVEPVR